MFSNSGEFLHSAAASSRLPAPEVVIAVDFGTTFSGFAYAKTSDTPLQILDNCKWPADSKAGAKPYCKNQTSLFYTPSPALPGHFDLQDWGWSAFLAFSKATASHSAKRRGRSSSSSSTSASRSSPNYPHPHDALNMGGSDMANKVGFFAHKFKLYLAPDDHEIRDKNAMLPPLPGDLTVERLVVDFLRKLTTFIMEELKVTTRKGFSMADVQWCLTVPAIWSEKAKQIMRICAEKAGMVQGPNCPNSVTASPRALQIMLEPEAASVYCLNKAKAVDLVKGDRILVADVGGGTIDIVVHEILEIHPTEGVTQVRDAVSSYGEAGGGTFVDDRFFELLCKKIGCFREFCHDMKPSLSILIYSWWHSIKTDFDGPGYTAEFSLGNSALGEAWQKYDRDHGIRQREDYYEELCLDDTEILGIFDPEVDKVLELIEKQIRGVRVLMVVGGFAGSVYLRKRVLSKFEGRVEEIIIPENSGSAICRGAVQLYMKKGYIKSRISKKTYGILASRDAEEGDPPEMIFVSDDGKQMCNNVFNAFVRAGESVEMNAAKKKRYSPPNHGDKVMTFTLYSSPRVHPRYINEPDAKREGQFQIDISQDITLDKNRRVDVTMLFGDSLITVSAARWNFGLQQQEQALSVTFEHT